MVAADSVEILPVDATVIAVGQSERMYIHILSPDSLLFTGARLRGWESVEEYQDLTVAMVGDG